MLDDAQVVTSLRSSGIEPDASQRRAIEALCMLLVTPGRRWLGALHRLHGVYCYGLPGRGKSMVVDAVFQLAPGSKRRIHFHEFLRDIHCRLVKAPRSSDRLADVAKAWLHGVDLLCFDEFHVHDIADAFLIGRFLTTAVAEGVRIVLTSNYAPDDLLPNREYHARFAPTIDMIKRHFTIVHFDGPRDYRFSEADTAQPRFFSPLALAREPLRAIFVAREGEAVLQPGVVELAGRPLPVSAAGESTVWVDFDVLCMAQRSHVDYLAMADRWRWVIIDNVHATALANPDTLQRLVWLIDILYDRKCGVCIASDIAISDALNGLEGAHDLSRTVSRLAEMQSRAYACFTENPLIIAQEN
ncbi:MULTISPECIES: cell division protein ZapE [Mycetohabitans]|nr:MULTISPECIES: cell division protein ZapE [Mycetohabitans]MCG1048544.1 cell division protein ZapE [Mycetohabitans sp. B6]